MKITTYESNITVDDEMINAENQNDNDILLKISTKQKISLTKLKEDLLRNY